jgi:hypothetical protein
LGIGLLLLDEAEFRKEKQDYSEPLFEHDQCGAQRESPRTESWGVHNETRRGSLGSETPV